MSEIELNQEDRAQEAYPIIEPLPRSKDGQGAIAYSDEDFLHTIKKEAKIIIFKPGKTIHI